MGVGGADESDVGSLGADDLSEEGERVGVSGDIGDTGVVGISDDDGVAGSSEAADDTGEPGDEVFPNSEDSGSKESFLSGRCLSGSAMPSLC